MGIAYLDSSVALRTILDVPERIRLQTWMRNPDVVYVSSRLLRTEVLRVLRLGCSRAVRTRLSVKDPVKERYNGEVIYNQVDGFDKLMELVTH